MKVEIKRVRDGFGDIPLPEYKSYGAAGMDLSATIDEDYLIKAGGVGLVPCGIAVAIPHGFECQIRSRSGMSLKHGIFALNAPGTIDSDYRGEIMIILANFSSEDYTIKRGDRIAQAVFARHETAVFEIVETLSDTERGSGGFGSTGKEH